MTPRGQLAAGFPPGTLGDSSSFGLRRRVRGSACTLRAWASPPAPVPKRHLLYSPLSAGDRCLKNGQRKQPSPGSALQGVGRRETSAAASCAPGSPQAAESCEQARLTGGRSWPFTPAKASRPP